MKRIVHVEDSLEWQDNLRIALASLIEKGLEVNIYSCIESFRKANYPRADLYVLDIHLPEKPSEVPNDKSWKSLLKTIVSLYPQQNIILLSYYPPKDWQRYKNVVGAVQKEKFNPLEFRILVENYLQLNSQKS